MDESQHAEVKQDAEQERCKGCQGKGGYDTQAKYEMDSVTGVTAVGRRRVVCMFCGGSGRVAAQGET